MTEITDFETVVPTIVNRIEAVMSNNGNKKGIKKRQLQIDQPHLKT